MRRKSWLMVLAVCLTGCTAKAREAKERPLNGMKKIIFIMLILTVCCFVSCGGRYKSSLESPEYTRSQVVQQLKQRIDSAEIRTFLDKDYNVEISYPDIFAVCDTTEDGTARLFYPSKEEREMALILFVEPNIEGWNIHEAVENLADSFSTYKEEGKDYYIMEGVLSDNQEMRFLEKCYLIDDMWINYTLYYPIENHSAIDRLFDLVREWSPRPSKNKEDIYTIE